VGGGEATLMTAGSVDEVAALEPVRRGVRRWVRSYRMMMAFDMRGLGQYLTVGLIVQILVGAGMAVMYGFYLGDVPVAAKTFLATGVPALALIPLGLVMVPNMVGQQRIAQTYDFIWSLPVPRLAAAASTFTVFTLMSLPGTAIALIVGKLYYGIDLVVTWRVIPAVLLTALMTTSVGFGLGHTVRNPMLVNFITNMIMFFVLLFSPIVVPIGQFPGWLAGLHRVLPFYPMAVVIRDSLSVGLVGDVSRSYFMLAAWTVAGWSAMAWVVGRRG
jgi:ABC-2 type transport system permease protein